MFKWLKQRLGSRICSLVPLDFWHWLLEVELVLPYWHMVGDSEVAHVSGLYKFRSLRQLKADLEFFLQYYTPVSLQDVIRYLDGVGRLPRRCFLPTFDDGFREIYDVVAPVFYAQGVPAVFFLITSVLDNRELCFTHKRSLLIHALASIGDSHAKRKVSQLLTNEGVKGPDLVSRIRSINYRQRYVLDELGLVLGFDFADYVAAVKPYLTSEQIKNLMRKGFEIGAHSVDHPLYSELSLEEQLIQTQESLSWLSKHFQFECQAFAFPHRDAGISPEFFQKVFSNGAIKVSFGTDAMLPHFYPRNLERFLMDEAHFPARQILAREFGRAFLRIPSEAGRE